MGRKFSLTSTEGNAITGATVEVYADNPAQALTRALAHLDRKAAGCGMVAAIEVYTIRRTTSDSQVIGDWWEVAFEPAPKADPEPEEVDSEPKELTYTMETFHNGPVSWSTYYKLNDGPVIRERVTEMPGGRRRSVWTVAMCDGDQFRRTTKARATAAIADRKKVGVNQWR